MICNHRQSHARRPRCPPRFPPFPTRILANCKGELFLLSFATATISRNSVSTEASYLPRTCSRTSRASSYRPTDARKRGLSGSILIPANNKRAGKHWKASKNRQRTSEYPLFMKASPKLNQYATEIPKSVMRKSLAPLCAEDILTIGDEDVSQKPSTMRSC